MSSTTLALTFHDPPGRMYEQLRQMLPVVCEIFGAIVVEATDVSQGPALDVLRAAGADIHLGEARGGLAMLGKARRRVMQHALAFDGATIMYCDTDRVLHWAMRYPDELREVVSQLGRYDFTVLGRTSRAYDSHPRVQRDTEAIVNHVYATISGNRWDVTAAARGCTRRAAERLVAGATDDTVGVDGTWPLWAQREGDLDVGYRETEGLEFETGDRFEAEVLAAGGLTAWIAGLDADPRLWEERLDLAHMEVAAMRKFAGAQLT